MHKYEKPRCVIVGVRGYAGLDLARLLLNHPEAELSACFGTESEFALSDYLPDSKAQGIRALPVAKLLENPSQFGQVVFLATPAEVSLELAPKLLNAGMSVIDLSGAFRLSAAAYPAWYGFEHSAPQALATAEYGLNPWCMPVSGLVRGPRLVANPGCYATSVLMALIPLLKAGLVDPETVVIDAKSGTSGAGRKAAENFLFTEVEGECLPYRIGKHQHLPEIQEHAKRLSGVKIDPFFSTHLLPVRRGIISGIYARLSPQANAAAVSAAYAEAYSRYPLMRVGQVEAGKAPSHLLSLKRVSGTARTHITFGVTGNKLYVFSCIDNLLKGAASQAVENLNRLYDFPIGMGLSDLEGQL